MTPYRGVRRLGSIDPYLLRNPFRIPLMAPAMQEAATAARRSSRIHLGLSDRPVAGTVRERVRCVRNGAF